MTHFFTCSLLLQRNFENAVQALGGAVLNTEKSRETFRVAKDGKEVWVELGTELTGKYVLTIVERAAMKPDVEGNALFFSDAIRNTGHAAGYGICFDTAKSELKPESEQAVAEIAKLLNTDPALKL